MGIWHIHLLTTMPTTLIQAVLSATDPLHGPAHGALERALFLLQQGTNAAGCLNLMVERDECYFEAIDSPHPAAIANAVTLIPLLFKNGDSLSPVSAQCAKYNCPPAIQHALGIASFPHIN